MPQGQVSAASARPWPRLGTLERHVDAESTPDLCSSSPPPLGGEGGTPPPP